MTKDAGFSGFKPVDQQWRIEYSRIRKLGGGDYWEGCRLEDIEVRSKMSPHALGLADHHSMRGAIERGDRSKPIPCPFDEGTPEKAEYNRGWDDLPLRPENT
jgi:hypothetical protein